MALTLQLNGETREFAAAETGLTVEGLLRALNLDPRKIAVERNLEIVPRSTYSDVQLTQNDRLEIVQDRKSTRLNSSHSQQSRMPSSA